MFRTRSQNEGMGTLGGGQPAQSIGEPQLKAEVSAAGSSWRSCLKVTVHMWWIGGAVDLLHQFVHRCGCRMLIAAAGGR